MIVRPPAAYGAIAKIHNTSADRAIRGRIRSQLIAPPPVDPPSSVLSRGSAEAPSPGISLPSGAGSAVIRQASPIPAAMIGARRKQSPRKVRKKGT